MMISDKEMTDMIADARTRREGFEALVRQYSEPLYWKIRHIVILSSIMKMPMMCCRMPS